MNKKHLIRRTIPGWLAEELMGQDSGGEFQVLDRQWDGERRWVSEWHAVFTAKNLLGIGLSESETDTPSPMFWRLDYEQPLTEIQEGSGSSWEDDDEVLVYAVQPVPVTVIRYEPLEEE